MTASPTTLADLVTSFFTSHLGAERDASGHTIASYRDTFKLLFLHASEEIGRPVIKLRVEDFDPDRILSFLDHLEQVAQRLSPSPNGKSLQRVSRADPIRLAPYGELKLLIRHVRQHLVEPVIAHPASLCFVGRIRQILMPEVREWWGSDRLAE